MAFQYAVVLTGSISTGKSTASAILKKLGFKIIDADKIAHEVLNQQHKEIASLFGASLVHDEVIDRKALGKIVFCDEIKRRALESLLHPLIYKKIEAYAEELDNKKEVYLIDIPLFFETNRYPIEKSIVVYTPYEIQIKRLMQRDKANRDNSQKRIDTQISIEEKVKKASYVIDNSGTLIQLEHECLRVKDEIIKDFK